MHLAERYRQEALYAEIDMLREENRQLKDRIAEISGLSDVLLARQKYGLTDTEARIFLILVRRGSAEYDVIERAIYDDRDVEVPDGVNMAIRSHIKRMRRKLQKHGIDFETVYSLGFRMADKARSKAKQAIAA